MGRNKSGAHTLLRQWHMLREIPVLDVAIWATDDHCRSDDDERLPYSQELMKEVFADSIVCQCRLLGDSTPPCSSDVIWSTTYP